MYSHLANFTENFFFVFSRFLTIFFFRRRSLITRLPSIFPEISVEPPVVDSEVMVS